MVSHTRRTLTLSKATPSRLWSRWLAGVRPVVALLSHALHSPGSDRHGGPSDALWRPLFALSHAFWWPGSREGARRRGRIRLQFRLCASLTPAVASRVQFPLRLRLRSLICLAYHFALPSGALCSVVLHRIRHRPIGMSVCRRAGPITVVNAARSAYSEKHVAHPNSRVLLASGVAVTMSPPVTLSSRLPQQTIRHAIP